ncbi:MAG: beta-ketoacyl-ACP synthase II [Deltaproteobacteria bacterium]|nr:beta-ketoacyl-ACP synthase II [Deltaproteobacteria bacterium]
MGGEVLKKRVVITGLGLVTPLGVGVKETWENLCQGKSGIGPITRFDSGKFRTRIAGEVKGFKAEEFMPQKLIKRLDVFVHYALGAARMAMEQSGLKITPDLAPWVGVVTGCGLGGLRTIEDTHTVLLSRGPDRISPFFIPMLIANMAPGQIAIEYGAKGPNLSVETACAAGNHAIGDSFKLIQRGAAKAMICGGVEAVVTPLAVGGFNAMRALSTRNEEPEKASRPFDKDRDGFVIAEGSGIMILEDLEFALERGAKILGEIVGYGLTGDAYHMTAPAPDGDGAIRCMQMALDDAGLKPGEIDYINAHGTSTDLNDAAETLAIKTVFKEHSYKLAVSSTKSMTGHLLGGAGGVESVFSVLTIQEGLIPPTMNLDTPDPHCDLDYVPNQSRKAVVHTAMTNSFGFGGTNAVLVFKKYA